MKELGFEIQNNQFNTKDDFLIAINHLLKPLESFFVRSNTRIKLTTMSSGAPDEVSQMEGFCRILWGLAVDDKNTFNDEIWRKVRDGIINGTNPNHKDYFGKVRDYDQRIVEMASFGYAFALNPEKIYEPLNEVQRSNLITWLDQINELEAHKCNWKFFRVMVNIGFKQLGLPYNKEKMEEHLNQLDTYYLGKGWYRDGELDNSHAEYYIPFGMHYYGLFYAKFMEDVDPQRCNIYRKRAAEFAEDFIYWFAKEGEALPYGRSLTYRFAQVSFWSAFVFADVKTNIPLGVIKGIILRHLRWWFRQPIFNSQGHLTVGYAYPNWNMAENYNAPGSVYWALKSFLIAALPDEHCFWTAEEQPLPRMKSSKIFDASRFIIARDEESKHLIAYNGGNYHTNEHIHVECKYEKFAYSTLFGFSVPRSHKELDQGAFDSTLAVSEDDKYYRHKEKSQKIILHEDWIYTKWKPFLDVTIETYIIVGHPWHIRIHRIQNGRDIYTSEGGFAIGIESIDSNILEYENIQKKDMAMVKTSEAFSAIYNLIGDQEPTIIIPPSNTNLMKTRTEIPTLKCKLKPGNHMIASYLVGDLLNDEFTKINNEMPKIQIMDNKIEIRLKTGKVIHIDQ